MGGLPTGQCRGPRAGGTAAGPVARGLQCLCACQQAWRVHVYHLIISYEGKVLRTGAPVAASQVLREWFDQETTGYQVVCHDKKGSSVTKAELRAIARHA